MANRFYINPPNPLEALMTGVQGYEGAQKRAQQADMKAGREGALQRLMAGDTKGALGEAIRVGDIQSANAIAQFSEQQANRGFREQEAQRAQGNADRSFGLQQQQFGLAQRQADLAAKGYDYKEVDDGQGGKTLVRIEKATGNITRPEIAGVSIQPANPYAPTQKLTEGEAKDRAYLNRMIPSNKIITGLENINEGATGFIGGMAAQNPYVRDTAAFNLAASKDRQKILQAQRDFVNSILRRESGAVISQSEFDNATRQYFPVPGDDAETITQKRNNRMLAIEGMMQGAGKGYKPPDDYIGTKGPANPNVQTAQPTQQTPRKTKTGVSWSVAP